MLKKKWFKITLASLGGLVLLLLVFSITQSVYPLAIGLHAPVYSTKGAAIGGYDAVSYYSGNAHKGRESHALEWQGARWLFASAENKQLFRSALERYAPQFGGYCAFAVSKGFTATADPLVWHIHREKLYLFNGADVLQSWLSDIPSGIVEAGDENWR